MKVKQMSELLKVLAERVQERENVTVSQYTIDKLKDIIAKAENEAGK